MIDPADLERELDEQTLLVSVMAANNEIGVLQPLAAISNLLPNCWRVVPHRRNTSRRTYGNRCRCLGRRLAQLLRPQSLWSAGIGALFVRSGLQLRRLPPGGAGTWTSSRHRVNATRRRLWGSMPLGRPARKSGHANGCTIRRSVSKLACAKRARASVCSDTVNKDVGNLNVGFPGFDADNIVQIVASEIAVSTGSACASATAAPSRFCSHSGLILKSPRQGSASALTIYDRPACRCGDCSLFPK